MTFAKAAYTALAYAMLPFVRARLAWRARREPGYGVHVAERFGRYDLPAPQRALVWIHAVSVGETRAAESLVNALEARYPDHAFLLTHMTPTGRQAGFALFGERVLQCYLPYDYPAAVARFLEHFKPRAGVLMETEMWPNLVDACRTRGVPLYLVNARLSEKSYRRYRRFAGLVRDMVSGLTAIAAQTDDDARRLRALGARRVTVTGNLKFDAAIPLAQIELGRAWRRLYGARAVLLAASTREGEEALVLEASASLGDAPLLVIVPRHRERFDGVAALLERRGLRYVRRSVGGEVAPDVQIVLGDSMGEMPAYYAACDVAFIGGSLLPFGGQNFIEACAVGAPVLLGAHTYNFAEAARHAIDAGAALRVEDTRDLAETAARLLADAATRARMSERAIAFSRAHQGATERVMRFLEL